MLSGVPVLLRYEVETSVRLPADLLVLRSILKRLDEISQIRRGGMIITTVTISSNSIHHFLISIALHSESLQHQALKKAFFWERFIQFLFWMICINMVKWNRDFFYHFEAKAI